MKVRRLRFILWSSAAIMAALAILSVVWTASPIENSVAQQAKSKNTLTATPNRIEPMVDPEELTRLCELDLRRPLHDPPPPMAPPPPPPKPIPPLNIHLTGTIIEPGHNQALIAMPDGSVELKNIGDDAGGAQVQEITEDSVTVEYFGRLVVLTVTQQNTN